MPRYFAGGPNFTTTRRELDAAEVAAGMLAHRLPGQCPACRTRRALRRVLDEIGFIVVTKCTICNYARRPTTGRNAPQEP